MRKKLLKNSLKAGNIVKINALVYSDVWDEINCNAVVESVNDSSYLMTVDEFDKTPKVCVLIQKRNIRSVEKCA